MRVRIAECQDSLLEIESEDRKPGRKEQKYKKKNKPRAWNAYYYRRRGGSADMQRIKKITNKELVKKKKRKTK